MKALYALPVILGLIGSVATINSASAYAFSYQKQWWPDAVVTRDGKLLGSGAAYKHAGPSGPDIWMDPRAWWDDYNTPGHSRGR